MGTYAVIQSNFDTYVIFFSPTSPFLATQSKVFYMSTEQIPLKYIETFRQI